MQPSNQRSELLSLGGLLLRKDCQRIRAGWTEGTGARVVHGGRSNLLELFGGLRTFEFV